MGLVLSAVLVRQFGMATQDISETIVTIFDDLGDTLRHSCLFVIIPAML